MTKRSVVLTATCGCLLLGYIDVVQSQIETPPAMPAAPWVVPSVKDPVFRPGLDDLMTMLIQPRHIRLYYAGTNRNWELATSEAADLRAAFNRIAQFMPVYLGSDVSQAVDSIIAPPLQGIDAAIAAAEPKKFAQAYADLTAACNACHSYMEHARHVIKVPAAKVDFMYLDQEFRPGR